MTTVQTTSPAMPIDVRALDAASAALSDRRSRLVGWGSGSVFEYFQGLHPVRLDYLVDNDSTRWGQTHRGVEIVSPQRLRSDDRASTFVVIYSSAWPDIQRQLAGLGRFASLPASAVFADAAARARLAEAERIAATAQPRPAPRSANAIVVQGPVVPAITARVLQVMTARNPDAHVVLSTWQDTDRALLDEARAIADDVVVSPRPAHAGIQNRNCQIVSTAAGISRAIALGATTILKTRTDLAVLATSPFAQARWLLDRLDATAPRAAGLRDRLIVPASYTRKFLLYHPSDLVMLGAASDLAQYWSAPLDPRGGSLLSPDWMDLPVSQTNLAGNPTESYLGVQFCRSTGRRVAATLADSWAFYRDFFAVVDNDWFDLLWFKNLSIPDAATRRGVRQLVSHQFWQRLEAADSSLALEMNEVDPETVTMRALAGACA
jgi:hypothetical protein